MLKMSSDIYCIEFLVYNWTSFFWKMNLLTWSISLILESKRLGPQLRMMILITVFGHKQLIFFDSSARGTLFEKIFLWKNLLTAVAKFFLIIAFLQPLFAQTRANPFWLRTVYFSFPTHVLKTNSFAFRSCDPVNFETVLFKGENSRTKKMT